MNTKKLILSSLVCFSFIIGTINITANATPNEESSDYISLSKLTASKKGTITNPSKDTVEYKFSDNIIKIDFTSPFININDKIIPLETEEINGLKLPDFKAKFKRNEENQIIVKSSLIKDTLNIEVNEKEEKKEDKTENTNELTNQDKEENTKQNVTTNTKHNNTNTISRNNHNKKSTNGNTRFTIDNSSSNHNNSTTLNSDINTKSSDFKNNTQDINSDPNTNHDTNTLLDTKNNNDSTNTSTPDTSGDKHSNVSDSNPSHESGVQKQPNTN